ncbi:MAG: tRNA lysidine(34) synthetase TilS [Ilumatobacteraceae bacterium]
MAAVATTHHVGDAAGLISSLLPRCTFPAPDTAVCCAVSGGPDSTALLVLAVAAGCRVEAVHVDHGLRDGSADELDVVRRTAATLGVTARGVRVVVAPGPNLEARARSARYAALPPGVLTGHTADDQAETVLLNVLRGAATDGLSGMRPGVAHPLLQLRRSETVALCRAAGLTTVDDATNADTTFLRNRVRHELLPLLGDAARRDLVPVLARQAALLRDDADLLDLLASEIDPTDARALTAAPLALSRRAVRRWLATDGDGHPPDQATVERVLAVASGTALACEVGAGRRVERHRQRLSLVRHRSPESNVGSVV